MLLALNQWGLPGLALMYGLEAMAVPVPIEIPLILSGALLIHGAHDFLTLAIITWAATCFGNASAFVLARSGGRQIWLRVADRFLDPRLVVRAESWVRRYGLGAMVFTRWINWGFGLSLWVTGLGTIPARRFWPVMLINNLIWSFAWVALSGLVARGMAVAHLPWWVVLFIPALFLAVGYVMYRRRVRLP